jgi:hypothetical protein
VVQVLLALAEAAVRCRRLEMSTRDRWPPGCSYCLNAQARRWRAAEADRLVSARVSAESKESSAGVPAIRVAYATLDSEHASQSIYLAVCVAELVL